MNIYTVKIRATGGKNLPVLSFTAERVEATSQMGAIDIVKRYVQRQEPSVRSIKVVEVKQLS